MTTQELEKSRGIFSCFTPFDRFLFNKKKPRIVSNKWNFMANLALNFRDFFVNWGKWGFDPTFET
ncbi:hypothetical protein JT096_04565 [Helicobacter pylori]|nr:hypothetical protein [Helicobacter pylori]